MKYAILYAPTLKGYKCASPESPKLRGRRYLGRNAATMKGAIEGYLECMREFGYSIPTPTTVAEGIEVLVD
jgi:hypothetical protein